MKRVIILIVGLISLVFLSWSSNTNKQDYYGTYSFQEVTYLSPLSSSTIDYLNEKMTGTKYIIESDLFKIQSTDNNFEISSPNYVKKKVQFDSSPLFDVHTLQGNDVKYQYDINNKNGNKTHFKLYVSSDYLWVASYVDNTVNGSETIMSIYKLSK